MTKKLKEKTVDVSVEHLIVVSERIYAWKLALECSSNSENFTTLIADMEELRESIRSNVIENLKSSVRVEKTRPSYNRKEQYND